MYLLAQAITQVQLVAILVLCIFALIFVLVNIVLVVTLHRQNKKLNMHGEVAPAEEILPHEE